MCPRQPPIRRFASSSEEKERGHCPLFPPCYDKRATLMPRAVIAFCGVVGTPMAHFARE